MTKPTHLIIISFYDKFPEHWTKQMIYAAMAERFKFLKDKLEKIEIEKA